MTDLPALAQKILIDPSGAVSGMGPIGAVFAKTQKQGEIAFSGIGAAAKELAGPAVLGAVAIGLFKVGQSFDAAFDKIRIKTGAMGPELDGLKDSFKNVVSEVPTSFGNAATAISEVHQRLDLTGSALERTSEQILELSRLQGSDLSGTTDHVTQLFKNWNVPTAQQNALLDEMFRISQKTGLGVDSMSSSVAGAGPVLRQVGLTVQQSSSLIGLLNENGVAASPVFMALGRSVAQAVKDGQSAPAFWSSLLDRIKAAPDDTAAAGVAIEAFGQRAGPKLAGLIREGKLEYEDLANRVQQGGDTIRKAAADTDDAAEKWTMFRNRLEVALEPIASNVFDDLTEGLDAIAPALDLVVKFLDLVQPAMGPVLGAFALYVVASKLIVPATAAMATGLESLPLGFLASGEAAEAMAARLTTASEGVRAAGAALPGAAAGSLLLATGFQQAGEQGMNGALGIGQMVAGGAMLGSVIPGVGTAVGALAGGVAGLAVQMFSGGESVDAYREKFEKLGTELDGLTRQQQFKKFVDQLGDDDKLRLFVGDIKSVTNEVRSLAMTNPAGAQTIVDMISKMRNGSGKALFNSSDIEQLNTSLEKGATKFRELSQAKDAHDATNKRVASSSGDVKAALDSESSSASADAGSIDKLKEAHDRLQNALLGQPGAAINYQQSLLDQKQANDDAAKALQEHGDQSDEYVQAQLRVQQANNQVAGSAIALDAANKALLDSSHGNKQAVDDQISYLERLKTDFPQAQDSIQHMIDTVKFFAALPPAKAKADVDTSNAESKLTIAGQHLTGWGHLTITAHANADSTDAHAKITGAEQHLGTWGTESATARADVDTTAANSKLDALQARIRDTFFTVPDGSYGKGLGVLRSKEPPPKAAGGHVWPGAYRVGEVGTELFTPDDGGPGQFLTSGVWSTTKPGYIHPAGTFDQGGTLMPGLNMVLNATGAPEHVTPTGTGRSVTLESTFQWNGNAYGVDDVEKIVTQMLDERDEELDRLLRQEQ